MNRILSGLKCLTSPVALVALCALSTTAAAAGPSAGGAKGRSSMGNSVYIVQMADLPVSAYQGGIPGLSATKPRKGQKIDPNSPAVVSYQAYLSAQQNRAMARVGVGQKLYGYSYVFNGFAAEMSASQAQRLAQTPGVLAVTKDEARKPETATTPGFLGLSGTQGFWQTTGARGEGVIIGIVDSGIWPEHPSVSDRTGANGNYAKDGKLGYQRIPGWNGRCEPGEAFTASNCNQKLIGARFYNGGFGGNAGTKAQFPYEFLSPRDFDGHGTHTATTAGGNAGVPASGPAAAFGTISGIAPRARIAAYKVCWGNGTEGGCFNSDSVAAIDQAVADGVDVINFSISGSLTNFLDPVEVAFMFAAEAGVFVAASAGNSGPTVSTVAHPSPWITTVAAGTHNREMRSTLVLGNGATYAGASSTSSGLPATATIPAADAGVAGADPTALRLCFSAEDNGGFPVLDPAKVAGKVVVCDRGVTARTSKSAAVRAAGGAGMILVNTSANTLNADLHFVPTIHISHTDGALVKPAVTAQPGLSSAISPSVTSLDAAAPFTTDFSSRGPLRAAGGDLLKPDLIAPGQDILAGVAPSNYNGRLFDLLSGTSMSSPHVAGLAALMKELRPGWSPMAIKSALMTTGTDVLDGDVPAPNSNPVLIFRQGAGHVAPLKAANPGVVYDHGYSDWRGFLCGTGQLNTSDCPGIRIDPSDLNVASIAIGDMAGTQTVRRTLTNVSGRSLTLTSSVSGMAGFNVTVSPQALTLAPGASAAFTLNFLRTSAALNAYTGGQLTWTGADHPVRSPIVVRPVALSAPAGVASAGSVISFPVTFGYDGPFSATARGLVAAQVTADTVIDDPTDSSCSLSSPNARQIAVAVPGGTTLARFALFDADVSAGADIDLCVFWGTTLVGASGSGTSSEEVNLVNPAAGNYTVVVQGWGVVGSSPFKLHTWLLGSADAGNMTVTAPSTATIGTAGTITVTPSGLAPATRYLGSVAYGGVAGLPNPTIVRIDTY